MKSFYTKILPLIITLLFTITVSAAMSENSFRVVIDRMVNAINKRNYPRIQQDFGKVMREVFPLKKLKPFFKNLIDYYGKIKKLNSPRFFPLNQAVFSAHFERVLLDIKIVLDDQDKIIGLWFLPHTPAIPTPDKHLKPCSGCPLRASG